MTSSPLNRRICSISSYFWCICTSSKSVLLFSFVGCFYSPDFSRNPTGNRTNHMVCKLTLPVLELTPPSNVFSNPVETPHLQTPHAPIWSLILGPQVKVSFRYYLRKPLIKVSFCLPHLSFSNVLHSRANLGILSVKKGHCYCCTLYKRNNRFHTFN